MAVSLVVMAVVQVVASLALLKAVKQVSTTVDALQRDVRPVLDKATKIADDASRVTALALVQAERLDVLLTSSTARIDETFTLVQRAVAEPIRQGSAIFAGFRAVFQALRAIQTAPANAAAAAEGEDPLFVG